MSEEVVSIVKWVNRLEIGGEPHYFGKDEVGASILTKKLSRAIVWDDKKLVRDISGYAPWAVTKKQLFEARLADK